MPRKVRAERAISRSFRLSKSILDGLEEEATLQKISTNALVSKILSDYVELERFSQPFGTIRVGRDTVRDFLQMVPEDELQKAGLKAGKGLPIAVMSAKYGKVNADSVLRFNPRVLRIFQPSSVQRKTTEWFYDNYACT